MKVATARVWKTADGKLVKDGDENAAFLFAAKGQNVPDSQVEAFDNGGDFFEDVKINFPEIHNVPGAEVATAQPGFSNIGKKAKEPEPQDNVPKLEKEVDPGFSNVGKEEKQKVIDPADLVPRPDESEPGHTNISDRKPAKSKSVAKKESREGDPADLTDEEKADLEELKKHAK